MKILYCNHELIKYHIAEALVMGGLPMSTTTENLERDIREVEAVVMGYRYGSGPEAEYRRVEEHLKRGPKLGKAKAGSGHDCFLKGIVVTAVVSLPAYQWPQVQRYHFLDIVSSQSKMHRITKMDLRSQCNDEVDQDIIDKLNGYIAQYNDLEERIRIEKALHENRGQVEALANEPLKTQQLEAAKHSVFRKIVNNAPHGLHLAAGIVTNYLQLKTMKLQRKTHKLEEWSDDFVAWVDALPYFPEFTGV